MELCLMTDSLGCLSFIEMVGKAASLGFESLELATGNWSQAPHLDLDKLLSSESLRRAYLKVIENADLHISALNCSGNPLAPGEKGKEHDTVVQKTFKLAEMFGVEKIVMMSGLPGGSPQDVTPNWIVTSWPPENAEILAWQWNERVIPYWQKLSKEAESFGIKKIALENHGCQCVYNVETLKRLRSEIGDIVGMNIDPSHMFWMGGDPLAMARSLEGMIYHVHAKDVRIEKGIVGSQGLLDTKTIDKYASRSWNYVSLGYGHDSKWWKEFFSILSMCGYDGPVSLEMEDMNMNQIVGTEKSVEVLKAAMLRSF